MLVFLTHRRLKPGTFDQLPKAWEPQGFTHWLVYGIPPDAAGIPEGGGRFTEGRNDFGNEGYTGPLPPEGHGRHHYYFWLYALDTEIAAGPGLTRAELLDAIDDHVIEQARMVGTRAVASVGGGVLGPKSDRGLYEYEH